MRVLVTGASGFVGRSIVKELGEKSIDIYTCGRKPQADLPNYFPVDITSKESVEKLAGQLNCVDSIIHSAGLAHQFQAPKDTGAFKKINVGGTENIARLASEIGCKKFIHISSISVYGDSKPNPCDEAAACEPSGSYAVSKYEAELAAREICQKHGINLVILRLATVYGEGDVGNVLRLIKLIDGGKFFWAGRGENGKSLIFNTDAARACRIAAEAGESDLPGVNIYNVTDAPHTMREIVETIAQKLGKKIPGISVPPGLIKTTLKTASLLPVVGGRARNLAGTLKKWQSDDVLSGEKIERELNFQAETSLAEGIKKEVEWYLSGKAK
jgi:UDP-glucose 4-epimerase